MALTFSVVSGALPMTTRIAGFRGSEGLSRPYAFDVYINVPGNVDVEIEEVVGSRATLLITQNLLPQAVFGGVFASFELIRALPNNALYLGRIVPRLWQLSLTRHSRMFTKQSIPEIIQAVLEDEGITDFELKLTGSYAIEEHVCQYKESSLDFIQRWMEREGMYYYFEQTEDGEKLVITDDKSQHPTVTTGAIAYHPTVGQDMSAGRHFDNFTVRHASLPATVKLVDYDYGKPSLDVSGSANVSPNGFGEVRDYGRRFFSPTEGARIARIRAEELRAQAAVYHATGGAVGLSAGYFFALEDHPRGNLNKDYLITGVEHFGYVGEIANAWGRLVKHDYEDEYRVDVMALSADQQYRHPCNTPWPRIDGFENGVVDGAATSEYAQIDDQGRYLVKFKFDEGTLKDGKASTFVRMM
jgi:type VI secretion system secreted protein VgrG